MISNLEAVQLPPTDVYPDYVNESGQGIAWDFEHEGKPARLHHLEGSVTIPQFSIFKGYVELETTDSAVDVVAKNLGDFSEIMLQVLNRERGGYRFDGGCELMGLLKDRPAVTVPKGSQVRITARGPVEFVTIANTDEPIPQPDLEFLDHTNLELIYLRERPNFSRPIESNDVLDKLVDDPYVNGNDNLKAHLKAILAVDRQCTVDVDAWQRIGIDPEYADRPLRSMVKSRLIGLGDSWRTVIGYAQNSQRELDVLVKLQPEESDKTLTDNEIRFVFEMDKKNRTSLRVNFDKLRDRVLKKYEFMTLMEQVFQTTQKAEIAHLLLESANGGRWVSFYQDLFEA